MTDLHLPTFAFYGRVCAEDAHDPKVSRDWQLARAEEWIRGKGTITEEFFDSGQPRSAPWTHRPEAKRLLQAVVSPHRKFHSVVIADPRGAFDGNQFAFTVPIFGYQGVELWFPGFEGAFDHDTHDLMSFFYTGLSKAQQRRIRRHTRAAMRPDIIVQSDLTGEPPTGFRVGDAGPRTNPAKATVNRIERALRVHIRTLALRISVRIALAAGVDDD